MRPLRSARQNSSSEASLGSVAVAPWSIWRSHSAAWYLLEAETTQTYVTYHTNLTNSRAYLSLFQRDMLSLWQWSFRFHSVRNFLIRLDCPEFFVTVQVKPQLQSMWASEKGHFYWLIGVWAISHKLRFTPSSRIKSVRFPTSFFIVNCLLMQEDSAIKHISLGWIGPIFLENKCNCVALFVSLSHKSSPFLIYLQTIGTLPYMVAMFSSLLQRYDMISESWSRSTSLPIIPRIMLRIKY